MLPDREQMLKMVSLPLHHLIEVRQVTHVRQFDMRNDVVLLEEGLSQMGAPSKMSFRFMQSSWLPSEWSLLPEHWQDQPTHEYWMHYCIHVRVTLGEGEGNQPPPSHKCSGSLIADMFQDGLEEWITEAVVLAPGKAILFFGQWSLQEGFPWEIPGMLDSAWQAQ